MIGCREYLPCESHHPPLSACSPQICCVPVSCSRRSEPAPAPNSLPSPLLLLSHHIVENVFGDVDRQGRITGDGDGDGVARAGVDFDELAPLADSQAGVVGMLLELTNNDVLELRPERFDRVDQ